MRVTVAGTETGNGGAATAGVGVCRGVRVEAEGEGEGHVEGLDGAAVVFVLVGAWVGCW